MTVGWAAALTAAEAAGTACIGLADVGLAGVPQPPNAALKLIALDCLSGLCAAARAGSAAMPRPSSAVSSALVHLLLTDTTHWQSMDE